MEMANSAFSAAAPTIDPDARVVIRELTRSDRAAVAFAFSRLGKRSRRQRFMAFKPSLSPRELDRLTDVDHWHHEALIALSPPPRAPVGTARYIRLDEFDIAEVAVDVVDAWQQRGVGRALMLALRERALRAGIRGFRATMLRDNRGAQALSRELGPRTHVSASGPEIEVVIALDDQRRRRADQRCRDGGGAIMSRGSPPSAPGNRCLAVSSAHATASR
jgi:GNAT superfamily N-acetyltransferase